MDCKYYRDLKHNYLVLENRTPEEEDSNRYQYKMVESGRIKGLLPCSQRSINGGRYLYYEIGSLQPIRDRFAVGGMNEQQLKGLLMSVMTILEELSEYLLGEEGLVFNAGSVYTNLNTGEYRFLYCPVYDESMSFQDFALELLDLTDLSDERAAELAYLLCEKSSVRGALTYEIIRDILAGDGNRNASDHPETMQEKSENRIFTEAEDYESDPFDMEEEQGEELSKKPVFGRPGSGLKLAGQKLGGRLQLLFSLMFAAVVGALMYIRMNFILTREENMLSILVMLVSLITGAVSLVGGIRDFKGRSISGKSHDTGAEEELYPEEDYDGFDDFDYSGSAGTDPIRITGPMSGPGNAPVSESYQAESRECGETVVLDRVKDNDELTLFSRNLDKTVRIGLEKLPLTIGKMEGCVDRVLGDSSVSRIHCRLQNEAGKYSITDLGSTNGTFLNGIKLAPRQKFFFDEGDEIRIGRVCFDCR